jgi:GT2 family glycosyltransferase
MNADLVSVIIPTFNRAYCVSNAVDSVLAQTHGSVEVIVVDDGSTDGTRPMMHEYVTRNKRVRYAFQDNAGVCSARNLGLSLSQGQYIALLDSDDTWVPWKLELQLACLKRMPDAGMIWTDMCAVDPDGTITSPAYLRQMYTAYRWFDQDSLFEHSIDLPSVVPRLSSQTVGRRVYRGDIYSQMIMGNLVHTSTVLLRRSRWQQVGQFDESLGFSGEDYDFHLRTCRVGPVAFADVATTRYQRGRPDRLTRKDLEIHLANNFLRTVTSALARDRPRIRLPKHMIDHVLAEAHGWVGEELLEQGDRSRAARQLSLSLRHRPLQPRLVGLLAASCLPTSVANPLRGAWRTLKHLAAVSRRGSPTPS